MAAGPVQSIRKWLREGRRRRELSRWRRAGRPAPPPHLAKQEIVREHAERYGCRVMVETGTYLGDMVAAMQPSFDRIYSIELSDELHRRARIRFWDSKNVVLVHGDSAAEIGRIASELGEQRTLFWLDGHWSGGPTAKGDTETPIGDELTQVLHRVAQGDVVLIDDARMFGSNADYPELGQVAERVEQTVPGALFDVDDDIIRICPAAATMRMAA